jgi:hypothetical protein
MTDSTTSANDNTPVILIKYFGVNADGEKATRIIFYDTALENGAEYIENGFVFTLSPLSELAFYMHKHAPKMNVKIHSTYRKTIKELYEFDYSILYDLLLSKGGKNFLGQVLIGLEELTNQQQKLEQWENDLM